MPYTTACVPLLSVATITNTQGETLIYDAGYLSGTMEVLDENFVESGVEDYAELVFKVHKHSQ